MRFFQHGRITVGMTKNVRFVLGILALAALVSAWYLLKLTGDSAATDNREREALAYRALLTDDDGDGLVAGDEQYWQTDPKNPDTDGDEFLDGEEILSGHDPRVPGPKDYLDRRQNLTQQTTDLLVGGLLSGELLPEHPEYQKTLDTFVRAVTEQYSSADVSRLVDLKVSADSDEAKLEYFQAFQKAYPDLLGDMVGEIGALLSSVKDVRIADPESFTADSSRYAAFQQQALLLADRIGVRAEQGRSIPVPPSFRRQHANIILTLQFLQSDLRRAAIMHEDPVLGMVALQRVIRLTLEALPLVISDFGLALNKKL